MLTSLILLVSIVLGILSLIIIFRNRSNSNSPFTIKYLIILLVIITLRYIFHFAYTLYPIESLDKGIVYIDIIVLLSIPCYYLYFEDLVYEKKISRIRFIHWVIPGFLALFQLREFLINPSPLKLSIIHRSGPPKLAGQLFVLLAMIVSLGYIIAGFKLLQKHIWSRYSDIKLIQDHNLLIKKWSMFLYGAFAFLFIARVYLLIALKLKLGYNHEWIWLPALLWCFIFTQIIISPELIYGYNFYKEKIEASSRQLILPKLWKLNNTPEMIGVTKDAKLSEKVLPNLNEYIHQIEEASFHSKEFRNPDLSIDDLALYLKIPASHLYFVFKYHCNDTFVDYKKFIRVHDAIKLMENGFLKSNTIESLAAEVGFVTYNTFHVAFKSITGVTTQEYLKRL